MAQYDLPYTGPQVEALLAKISELESEMPSKTSDLTNDSGFITSEDVPTKTSDLNNDSGFITNAPVAAEAARAQAAEALLATIASLNSEIERATGVEDALQSLIDAIEERIPSAASASNQLADKAFVNSSIATATAEFRGTYNSLAELQAVSADQNDYGYVRTTDAAGNTVFKRYKYASGSWVFEYDLNNSSFTASQWAAINSAVTAELVAKLSALPDNATLTAALAAKQDIIDDLSSIRSKADSAYQKPSGGIPASDIADGVIPDIADNLTTNDATKVLSAKQGKVLNENLTQLGQEVEDKVDKVEGKSLIDSEYASSQGIAYDQEYIQASLDDDDKILEGIKKDGTKVIHVPVEIQGIRKEVVDSGDLVSAIVDNDGKILESFNSKGEKFIGKFDETTEAMIKRLIPSIATNETIRIPLVDSNFTSPIPVLVTGVKGSETAKYDFSVSLGEDAFNIRVKFKVTDNLLNQGKNARILKLGNVVINASFANLSQYSTQEVYDGNPVTMLWPDFNGGVKYGDGSYMLGQYAFYIKYTGNEDSASVENTGEKLILKRGSITTEFPFSTYDTVSSLYDALKMLPDIEIDYKEVEGRTTDELAVFPEFQIKLTCYTRTDGSDTSEIQEYVDTPPLFIPFAIDDSWHQIEVVKIGNTIFACCDGATHAFEYGDSSDYSTLTLGDGNKMLFKDVVLSLNNSNDAEFYENGNRIVSSVNPAIIIFEGHGIYNGTISESSDAPNNMATSTDRLYYVFGRMKSMGYVPVSIHDIGEFYSGNVELPKRCFSIIFDDFNWENCLNAAYRNVFRELGVYPALAILTDTNVTIIHNGSEITKKEAAEICLRNDFSLLSHTRNHWSLDCVRLSTLISELIQNIYSADNCLVDGSVLVYPKGRRSKYLLSTLRWLGYSLGIGVSGADTNYASNLRCTSRYNLIRVEIGIRTSLDVIFNKVI